jgi:plastocyanin
MFNTVAKIELGLAAVAFMMAVGVAVAVDDPGGFVLLFGVSVAVALSGLALTGSGFTDRAARFASPDEAPPLQMVSVGRSQAAKPSPWPLAGALALGVFCVGVAVGHSISTIGVVLGFVAAAGWLSQAWREDPAFSPREGARISERLLSPVGLPLMAVGLIAVIVISVSRLLLTLPKTGSIIAAFGLSIVLLIAFFMLASRPHLGRNSLVFLGGTAVVAVVSAGSVSAANGYRTFEHHGGAEAAPIAVVARGTAFSEKTITVESGQPATIDFKNDDPVYHNIAVYSDSGSPFWNGEPIKGVKKITYTHTFDMPPGTYTFRCDFHPTSMVGSFVVAAAPAGVTP